MAVTRSAVRRIAACDRGAAAVEFAIIAPIFILSLLTLVAYGIYLGAAHSVQQLAADAARTAVAGVTQDERIQLVNNYINASTMNDPFLDRSKITATVAVDPLNVNQFTVSIAFDAENLPIWNLYSFALPGKTISRFSTIRMGGI
jgi:Flp pilus assembly protein TadG